MWEPSFLVGFAAGGSGGAHDTVIFAIMWPDLVRNVAVWTIVGGTLHCLIQGSRLMERPSPRMPGSAERRQARRERVTCSDSGSSGRRCC